MRRGDDIRSPRRPSRSGCGRFSAPESIAAVWRCLVSRREGREGQVEIEGWEGTGRERDKEMYSK